MQRTGPGARRTGTTEAWKALRFCAVVHFPAALPGSIWSEVQDMLMKEEKGAYLRQLTAAMPMHSVEVGREMEGSSPPSIFIGSWNYPKVFAGPMIAPVHGDTRLFDTPETWIPSRTTQEEIIGYRLSLVRGKRGIDVADVDGSFAEKLQAIALSSTSLESEVRFTCTPTGLSLSDEHTPHGPSAPIERFSVQNGTWDRDLERVFYDGDLRASEGILGLHRGNPFFEHPEGILRRRHGGQA